MFKPGKNIFIRTVTHHFTGRLVNVTDHELIITDAAWIPDDGRFSNAVKSGVFAEVEPFPDGAEVMIGRAALIDAIHVDWELPREQKTDDNDGL